MCAAAVSASVITGVTIESVTGEYVGGVWDLRAVHLVDGSGLTGDVHGSCRDMNTCWQNGEGSPVPVSIVFDLEGAYAVTSMHIWNGYWADWESARSANSVAISTSSNLSDWVSQGTHQFEEAPSVPSVYTGFDVGGLDWQNTRYVKFDINSNYGGGSCGGCITMAEVQFSGDDSGAVPEPGSLALVAAASMALLWHRRRRPAR